MDLPLTTRVLLIRHFKYDMVAQFLNKTAGFVDITLYVMDHTESEDDVEVFDLTE